MKRFVIFCLFSLLGVNLYSKEALFNEKQGNLYETVARQKKQNKQTSATFNLSANSFVPQDKTPAFFTNSINPQLALSAVVLPGGKTDSALGFGINISNDFNFEIDQYLTFSFFALSPQNEDGLLELELNAQLLQPGESLKKEKPNYTQTLSGIVQKLSKSNAPRYLTANFRIPAKTLKKGDFVYFQLKRNNKAFLKHNNLFKAKQDLSSYSGDIGITSASSSTAPSCSGCCAGGCFCMCPCGSCH